MSMIRSIRGGDRDNDPEFGTRMRGSGPWYDLTRTRFLIACRRHGLDQSRVTLRSDLFRPPAGSQGLLF
jgi:hypothetical protein